MHIYTLLSRLYIYINCDFEVTSPQHNHYSKKLFSITHAVPNKVTTFFNSSISKNIKSPVSS